MQANIIAAVWTLATESVSRTALDCCTAMNCPAKSPPGLVQIAESTPLRTNNPMSTKMLARAALSIRN
jgi:hypothetical protein